MESILLLAKSYIDNVNNLKLKEISDNLWDICRYSGELGFRYE